MNYFWNSFKLFVAMLVLTGLIYPAVIALIGQTFMHYKANGSLVKNGNVIIGSALISQQIKGDAYFWPRPSAIDFDPIKPSGGSNYGPTSEKLKEQVQQRNAALQKSSTDPSEAVPAELVYASGSGLDPHISLEAAYFQIGRVAKSRAADKGKIKSLVDSMAEGNLLGFLGPRYVNVLLLNMALDKQFPAKK